MKFINRYVYAPALAGTAVALISAGCASDNRGASNWEAPPTYYKSASVQTVDPNAPISRTRVDITDSGPGNPRGDATAADPSETSSQGAGSRALVGQQGQQMQTDQGGSYETTESASGSAAAQVTPQNNYNQNTTSQDNLVIPLHREEVQVGKREVDAGTVRIRKTVQTQTVNEPVQLREETVTIDRQPANGGVANNNMNTSSGQPFQEQEYTIHLRREEPVVQKRIVPAGEVVAQKQVRTDQQQVQEQVRRENVSIDKGNAQNVTISGNLNEANNQNLGGANPPTGQSAGSASAMSSSAVTDLRQLSASAQDATSLAGRSVRLAGAKVQAVVGQHLIALRNENGQPVYVWVHQAPANLREGATLDVDGTVRQATQNVLDQLSGDAAHILSQQPFFIDAQSVQPR